MIIIAFDMGKNTGVIIASVLLHNIVVLKTFINFKLSIKGLFYFLRKNLSIPVVFVVGCPITDCYKFSNKTQYIIETCNIIKRVFKVPVILQNEVLSSKLNLLYNKHIISA